MTPTGMNAAGWRLGSAELRRHGERIAVEGVSTPLTYALLAERAEAIAEALRSAGVRAGDRVACVSAGRAHDEPCALAGILAAGAVVVPLDAGSPPLRLATLLAASGCRALVHDAAAAPTAARLGEGRMCLELDEHGAVLGCRGAAPETACAPDPRLACVLHTSGSTGTPKPIPIEWAGLDAFTAWMGSLTGMTGADRVLRVAELTFDLAWFDHLGTWRHGGTLCTASRRTLAAGKSLLAALDRLAPTIVYAVPSLLSKLVAALPAGRSLDPRLRVICFAGEVYPPRQLAELAARAPAAALFNLYGPTETNVCTFHEVDRTELDGVRELPIGLACPYADCRLVDDAGAVVAGPGAGELWVRGPTAVGGEVATRDRVERGADGRYYFRGRIDRMLKIRGYRIDPSEIEAALAAHPAVREAAVVPVDDPRLGTVLCGHVALLAASPIEPRALRQHLAARLAAYMVPERIDVHDALPRTTTGKIDYRAL